MSKTKALPPVLAKAIHATTSEFARCMITPLTNDRARYLAEVLAVTRAAAIGGEYQHALKGYELLGKALGHVSENHQHLHLHQSGAPLSERTDAELVELMRAPPPPPPALPDAVQAAEASIVDEIADEAEAEAILYGL